MIAEGQEHKIREYNEDEDDVGKTFYVYQPPKRKCNKKLDIEEIKKQIDKSNSLYLDTKYDGERS